MSNVEIVRKRGQGWVGVASGGGVLPGDHLGGVRVTKVILVLLCYWE